MDCHELTKLIHPYVDGELGLTESEEVRSHLEGCEHCRKKEASLRALSSSIKRLPVPAAPTSLRTRWEGEATTPVVRAAQPLRLGWQHLAVACCLLLAFFVGRVSVARNTLSEELVASHVRSLLAGHLVDVESSDRHTVKPWFEGKVDYSATPYDLASQGFPLIGGRLDYIEGRRAEVFVYKRRLHSINLYVLPGQVQLGSREVQGFHFIPWSQGGFTYIAVSDASLDDLQLFQESYRSQG